MTISIKIPALTVCTGRIKTFILEPEKQTMAGSCTLYVYDNNLGDCLLFTDRALRGGAGVKIQLEKFIPRALIKSDWCFDLSPVHSDFSLIQKLDNNLRMRYQPSYQLDNAELICVADSMEQDKPGQISIRNSWLKFIELAKLGKKIIIDLSALRPAGTKNGVGLIATGPLGYGDGDGSFLSVYAKLAEHLRHGDMISLMRLLGQLNRVLRRGGTYKNGIVCAGLHYQHPDIRTFLETPITELPGGQKKGIRFDEGILADSQLCQLVVDQLNKGGLFLEKIIDAKLYANVCLEIQQQHKGVCLLSHANAAMCHSPIQMIEALVTTTKFITEIHLCWRKLVGNKADIYLPLESDRQIGVGWCGLANFLRKMGVSYAQHVEALEALLEDKPYHGSPIAKDIAECLVIAYFRATRECDRMMADAGLAPLERIFTMAPCQRNWVDYQDPDGYALCRSIDPPFNRYEYRDSHTDHESTGRYDHGPVEIMSSVGHDLHQRHWETWQRIMNSTYRAHTMSFDLWKKVDINWFKDFVTRSPLQTTYYQFADKLDQQYLNKGMILEAVEACDLNDPHCQVCAE